MADDLRTRLESHSKAFEGLMSLIPAKYYYGEDNDDQWQRKKQTKEEKRAAKRAKLDPDAYKSALDVHKEKEQKRKRELASDGDGGESDRDGNVEQPKQGLVESRKSLKKQKLNDGSKKNRSEKAAEDVPPEDDEALRRKKRAEKRKEKRERKQAKKARKLERAEETKAKKTQELQEASNLENLADEPSKEEQNIAEDSNEDDAMDSNQIESIDFEDAEYHDALQSQSSRSPSPTFNTPTFSNSLRPSSASSTSSINPPSEPETAKPAKEPGLAQKEDSSHQIISNSNGNVLLEADSTTAKSDTNKSSPRTLEPYEKTPKLPPINQELLKERLTARINALRAERKADGLDGKPARNRAELIEARRRKEEARRSQKKELRNKAKEQDVEAEAARLRGGSDSPLWSSPGVFGPPKGVKKENNFAFGRVAFDDGTQVDPGLTGLIDPKKTKGPQDPKTALEAAQRKQSRLNGLDEEKRADIAEKDRWLNAKKRVQGERVRDDMSLLKKTLKRKQQGKDNSEKAWKDRTEGIQKSIDARQAKREENLMKRKEEKAGKKGKFKGSAGPTKPKKRPGFEGSFKTGPRRML